jgi:hypothetical protein
MDEQVFRDKVSSQIHQLTGTKPRIIKDGVGGRYVIYFSE